MLYNTEIKDEDTLSALHEIRVNETAGPDNS